MNNSDICFTTFGLSDEEINEVESIANMYLLSWGSLVQPVYFDESTLKIKSGGKEVSSEIFNVVSGFLVEKGVVAESSRCYLRKTIKNLVDVILLQNKASKKDFLTWFFLLIVPKKSEYFGIDVDKLYPICLVELEDILMESRSQLSDEEKTELINQALELGKSYGWDN